MLSTSNVGKKFVGFVFHNKFGDVSVIVGMINFFSAFEPLPTLQLIVLWKSFPNCPQS